jgi:hypothetical protein
MSHIGHESTAKPCLWNVAIARGMCAAEVMRSQRSPELGCAVVFESTAFS